MFAYDTKAIISADSIQSLQLRLSEALEVFQHWFTINGFRVNASKTNLILYRTISKNKIYLNCALNLVDAKTVVVVKFLGVKIYSHLNWRVKRVSSAPHVWIYIVG